MRLPCLLEHWGTQQIVTIFKQSGIDDEIWDDTALIEAYDRAVSLAKEKIRDRDRKNSIGASESNSEASSAAGHSSKHRRKKNWSKSTKAKSKQKWKVGDHCSAVFREDGKVYEALIESIDDDSQICTVWFIGYGNTDEIILSELLQSQGEHARKRQKRQAESEGFLDEQHVKYDENFELSVEDPIDRNLGNQSQKGYWNQKRHQSASPSGMHHTWHSAPPQAPPVFFPKSSVPPMPPPPPIPFEDDDGDSEPLAAMLMAWYMSGYHTGYYQGLKQGRAMGSVNANSSNISGHACYFKRNMKQ